MKKPSFDRVQAPAKDIYATVTASLIAAIESHPGEWTMPWRISGQSLKLPVNAQSRRAYRGINTVVLGLRAHECGYARAAPAQPRIRPTLRR